MTKHLRIAAFVCAGIFVTALPQAIASDGDQTTKIYAGVGAI